MLEFYTYQVSNPPGLAFVLADDCGPNYAGQRRYVRKQLSDHEMIFYRGSLGELLATTVKHMVDEFNKYGKKVKVVPLKTRDDISNKLPLFDLSIALMYWSDVDG